MSTLSVSKLALRRFRLSGALRLGLILVAAQAALFEGVIFQPGADGALAAFAAPATEPSTARCQQETIMLDEGYGLRGQDTRVVCGR